MSTRTIFIEPIGRSLSRATIVASRSAVGEAFIRRNGRTSTMVEVKRFSVGELATRAGVATSALRFYEANGLIASERNSSGHRRYRPDALRRVAFIQVAQRIGLSLGEVGEALASLPSGRTVQKSDWRLSSFA